MEGQDILAIKQQVHPVGNINVLLPQSRCYRAVHQAPESKSGKAGALRLASSSPLR